MAILPVNVSTDFRGGSAETNIDQVVFQTPDLSAYANFDPTQFGAGLISNSVNITGDSAADNIQVLFNTTTNFSAANWTFTNWTGEDYVRLVGSDGGDTITGSDRNDIISGGLSATNGADQIDAGAGDDTIIIFAEVAVGTTIDGGTDSLAGVDELAVNPISASSIDLRNATITRVERLSATGNTTVIVDGGQVGTGNITQLDAGSTATMTLRVIDDNVDLRGVTFLSGWNTDDAISIEGTSTSSNLLFGSSWNDSIKGSGDSLDTMSGGAGADTLVGGRGADNFRYFAGSEVVSGEQVDGGLGSDALSLFSTGAIDFTLVTISSVETLDFVSGHSAATFSSAQIGAGKVATISGSAFADGFTVNAATTNIDLSGLTFSVWSDATDIITLNGTASADTLTGTSHADVINGAGGADSMTGGGGNDTYVVDASGDTITEGIGGGTDLVESSASFTLDMTQEIERLTLTGGTAVNGTGNGLANTITGNAAANVLKGLGGTDTIDGAGGTDTADYSDKTQNIDVTLNGAVAVAVKVNGANEDSIANVENIIGGLAGDRLTGDNRANSFVGGGGNDTVVGGAGADTLDGGAGSDTAQYSNEFGIRVALDGAAAVTVQVNGIVEDTISDIENISSGKGDDRLIGDGNDNIFSTSAGNDFMRGGLGHDTLYGGSGIDTADYSDKSQKVKVVLKGEALATAEVNGAFEDSLSGIENIIGGSAADKLTGDANDNSFKGLRGKDTINGGAGSDQADYSDKTKKVEVALKGASAATVRINGVAEDTLKKIEGVIGGSAADKLTGDGEANLFKGMGGKDTIDGGAGIDTADFSDKTKKVALTLNGGTAVIVKVKGVNDDTIKNIESVIGGSAGDKLTGDDKTNTFKGMGGTDTINGGKGVDTADFSDKTAGVELTLNGGTAVIVKVAGVAEDSIKNIENLIGGRASDKLTGDAKSNSFMGLGGQDIIDGGAGSDTANYSDRTEQVKVALNGSTQVLVSGDGDLIKNIENVIGGAGGDVIIGDGFANLLIGNGGNDTLKGGEGKNTLVGGDGNDVLAGGAVRDKFVFNSALSASTNVDTIENFTHDSDIIQLDDAIFKKIGGTLDANEFRTGAGVVEGVDANDRIIYDSDTGFLYFDIDGNKAGGKAAVHFASLNHVLIDAGDFAIV